MATGATLLLVAFASCLFPLIAHGEVTDRPNVIIVLTDDQGYSDLSAFGATRFQTPVLDQMARTGLRLTNFYAQASCGPSRAALLTGFYPSRVGLNYDPLPNDRGGMRPELLTLGELFTGAGYRTGYFGKWHLGDRPESLPTKHGFERFLGLPYSNSMWPFHWNAPASDGAQADPRLLEAKARVEQVTGVKPANTKWAAFPPLPLIEGDVVVESNPDQRFLVERFTKEALDFISETDRRPFFIMLAYHAPHVPLFPHPDFEGKSQQDRYGDVVAEIDFRFGEVQQLLEEKSLSQNTILIFLSDNGPWVRFGIDAGSSLPFRGGKETMEEGGWRVPAVVKWQNRIPARESDVMMSMKDWLPTLAEAINVTHLVPQSLDGVSRWGEIVGETIQRTARDDEFIYLADFSGKGHRSPVHKHVHAVRQGRFKLRVDVRKRNYLGFLLGDEVTPLSLFDLEADPGELRNILADHPAVVEEMVDSVQDFVSGLCSDRPIPIDNPC